MYRGMDLILTEPHDRNEMGLGKTHVECLIGGSYGIQQGQIGTSNHSKEV